MDNVEGSSTPYTKYFDPLVALVTHLSAVERKSRSVPTLAHALGFEENEVRIVLERFRGLFRRSPKKNTNNGEYYYTVHLRYARRPPYSTKAVGDAEETDEEETVPLDSSEISALLQLISSMVSQENETSRLLLEQNEALSRLKIEIEQRDRASSKTSADTLKAANRAAIASVLAAIIAAIAAIIAAHNS